MNSKISRNTIWPKRKDLIDYYNEIYLIQNEINQHVQSNKRLEIEHGRELLKLIENVPDGNRALDIGCGTGELANRLLKKYVDVYGTEISSKSLDIAKQKYHNINFDLVSDMMTLPYPDNYFDLVVSNQVIEHIYPDECFSFFSEINRVLKRDGKAIVSTPNGDEIRRRVLWKPILLLSFILNKPETYIASKLYWIQSSILSKGTAKAKLFKKYQFLEHINIVSPRKVGTLSNKTGLEIVSFHYDGFRPIFPRLYGKRLQSALLNIEKNSKYFRRYLMSNMTILLKKY